MRAKDLVHSNQIFALIAKGLEGSKAAIISVIIARSYSAHDLGIFSYVLAVGAIIAIIAEFRLHSVVVRELNTGTIPKNEVLGSAISAISFFALIGIALIGAISFYEKDTTTSIGLAIFGISYILKIPRPFKSYYTAQSKNSVNAKCEIVSSTITLAITLYLAINNYDLIWIIATRVGDFFIGSLLLSLTYYLDEKKGLKCSWSTVRSLTGQSAPLVLSGAAMLLFQRLDLVFVKNILGTSEAGYYTAAITVMSLFSIPPMVISESLAPKLFKSGSEASKQQFCNILFFLGFSLSLCMLLTSLFAIDLIFGEDYKAAILPATILSASPLLIALGASAGQIIVFERTQHLALIKCIIACIVSVMLNIILIPTLKLAGAATATVAGLFIANYISHLFIPAYRHIFKAQNNSVFIAFRSIRGSNK
ncbi:oligosaccharide flippase family protein [Pseudomonas abyssi]|nr:oligosaccharide flippase family protein [Halopseudomonas gallaeciensis]